MPSNWLTIDSNFPSFTGKETPQQQIQMLHNYLFQLREGLQYSLQNLSASNFNAAALQNLEDAQKNEVTRQLVKVYDLLNQMSGEISSLTGRVSGIENLAGRVTGAEADIDALEEWTGAAEEQMAQLQQRTESLDSRVKQMEDAVTGEGGLQEQMGTTQREIGKLSSAVQVASDGSATIGSEEKPLRLVGQVYINGVLYEQGGAT